MDDALTLMVDTVVSAIPDFRSLLVEQHVSISTNVWLSRTSVRMASALIIREASDVTVLLALFFPKMEGHVKIQKLAFAIRQFEMVIVTIHRQLRLRDHHAAVRQT